MSASAAAAPSSGLHASLVDAKHTDTTADSAASSSAVDADTIKPADRRGKRLAKEQRKQNEAAEKRRLKNIAATTVPTHSADAAESSASTAASASSASHGVDDGTESAPFGNFHTYYQFNPPAERLQFIPRQMSEYVIQRKRHRAHHSNTSAATFSYLDVGCNEGDLTIALMKHLIGGVRGETNEAKIDFESEATTASASSSSSTPFIFTPSTASSHPHSICQFHGIGVDIDPLLIDRAKLKISSSLDSIRDANQNEDSSEKQMNTPPPTLQFDTIDVMEEDAIERIRTLIASVAPSSSASSSSPAIASPSPPPFDLVTCYSITMWIHLHHGDSGLRTFLFRLSSLTQHLIIEPQPWKCYLNARERWRRCGKEDPKEMKHLKWRTNVETQIIEYVEKECQMKLRKNLGSTKWQRKVLWFERG